VAADSHKVTFQGSQGDQLAARLDLPAGQPRGYALFAHCFSCSKDIYAAARISNALVLQGWAMLRFDFTGLGASEGDFSNTNFSSNVADLVAAANYLRDKHEAPRMLIGHSLGGAAVLMAALDVPEAIAVATIGAPSDPSHVAHNFAGFIKEIEQEGEAQVTLGGRPFKIKKQFLEDIRSQNVLRAAGALKKALMIMHAPLDDYVGIENASELFRAARHPKSYVSLDTADHLLTRKRDAFYVGNVLNCWADRYLPESEMPGDIPQGEEGAVIVQETGRGKYGNYVVAAGHVQLASEPEDVGGDNSGPSPYDYLSAALGACTSITLRMYADLKKLPLKRVTVRIRHEKKHAEDCEACRGKVDHITREIRLEGDLNEAHRIRLREIADKCPVHKTLNAPVIISTTMVE